MHILVTGFAPFDNQDINPSWEAVTQLENIIGTHTIDKLKLPTSFKKVDTIINKTLASNHYDVVLAIGQAGGRNAITQNVSPLILMMHVFQIMMIFNLLIKPFI